MNSLLLQALLLTSAPDAMPSADAPTDTAHLALTQDAAPTRRTWGGAATLLVGYPDGVAVQLGG